MPHHPTLAAPDVTPLGAGALVSFRPEPLQIIDLTTRDVVSFEVRHPQFGGKRFSSNVRPADLEAYALRLRCVPNCCRNAGEFLALPKGKRVEALQAVAKAGLELFEQLIPDNDRNAFVAMLQDFPGTPIRACGAAASVPWEGLCFPGGTASRPAFLGSNRLIIRDTRTYRSPRSGGPVKKQTFGHVTDDGLASVATNRANSALRAFGVPVDTLEPITLPAEEYLFSDFFCRDEGPLGAYHLDCHVEPGQRDMLPGSAIRVTEGHPIEFGRLKSLLKIVARPFVFLNLCFGGSLSLGSDMSYARQFADAGAGEIVATETAVGDDFAAEFAETFYVAASAGLTVGAALLRTRVAFLEYDLNPAALFYSLYSQGDSRLELTPPTDDGSYCGRWERARSRLQKAAEVENSGGEGM
jgi:hypothetical protein